MDIKDRKDAFGEPLEEGQLVVTSEAHQGSGWFEIGKIIGFTAQRVKVVKWFGNEWSTRAVNKNPSKLLVVSSSVEDNIKRFIIKSKLSSDK